MGCGPGTGFCPQGVRSYFLPVATSPPPGLGLAAGWRAALTEGQQMTSSGPAWPGDSVSDRGLPRTGPDSRVCPTGFHRAGLELRSGHRLRALGVAQIGHPALQEVCYPGVDGPLPGQRCCLLLGTLGTEILGRLCGAGALQNPATGGQEAGQMGPLQRRACCLSSRPARCLTVPEFCPSTLPVLVAVLLCFGAITE